MTRPKAVTSPQSRESFHKKCHLAVLQADQMARRIKAFATKPEFDPWLLQVVLWSAYKHPDTYMHAYRYTYMQ